ncbi:MAG: CehA/McbA family metallohydrolase domain-containing protein [Planctomycetota bacterium]|jgi:hypothetical protein
MLKTRFSSVFVGFLSILLSASVVLGQSLESKDLKWYKGNTHCHSWWSDGDSPPEMVAAWYKKQNFNFLVISDHNTLNQGVKWYLPRQKHKTAKEAAKIYEDTYGPDWVETRKSKGQTAYVLKTLNEYRSLFEEPAKFILIAGEEITTNQKPMRVHSNVINNKKVIPPPTGNSISEIIQQHVDAVHQQQSEINQPMLVHLNHPQFGQGISAEDTMTVRGLRFVEIFDDMQSRRDKNGNIRFSVERFWDIVLTKRLAELSLPIIYGIASDDSHSHVESSPYIKYSGQRYIMVKARFLTPAHIIRALKRGDFYCSTGVVLEKLSFEANTLTINIKAQPEASYTTQFIGTLKGYDRTFKKLEKSKYQNLTRLYSDDIGKVLSEQTGTRVHYRMSGQEIYVRAKVTALTENPEPKKEVAWLQPVIPK